MPPALTMNASFSISIFSPSCLKELIVQTDNEHIEIAKALTSVTDQLRQLRKGTWESMLISLFCNKESFTHNWSRLIGRCERSCMSRSKNIEKI